LTFDIFCVGRAIFVWVCTESLTDMLTDEIESVRVAALLALGRLRYVIEFSEVCRVEEYSCIDIYV